MTNSEIAQCIEDMKQVRATALANARQALEEAFSAKFSKVLDSRPDEFVKIIPKSKPNNLFVHILED